jgi:hypothetical protein
MASWLRMISTSQKRDGNMKNIAAGVGSEISKPEDLRNCTGITELNGIYSFSSNKL